MYCIQLATNPCGQICSKRASFQKLTSFARGTAVGMKTQTQNTMVDFHLSQMHFSWYLTAVKSRVPCKKLLEVLALTQPQSQTELAVLFPFAYCLLPIMDEIKKNLQSKEWKSSFLHFYYMSYPSYFNGKNLPVQWKNPLGLSASNRQLIFFLQCELPFCFLRMPLGKIHIRNAWVAWLSPGANKEPAMDTLSLSGL